MKYSKSSIIGKSRQIDQLCFEDQRLTSFSGLVVFQKFFSLLNLKFRLQRCFIHLNVSPIYGYGRIVLLLIIHLLLGFRELRDVRYYQDDPMVKRILGIHRIPDAATVSRSLANMDAQSVGKLRQLNRELILSRLQHSAPTRLTLDFDGSVQSTTRYAQGSAVGFNKKKKGARSYYPLFCTVAQTGQVFDVHHRAGNVHDSNGAKTFILQCIAHIRSALPQVKLELRMDSAFFNDGIVSAINASGVEFSVSVPFERFVELKGMIERRRTWNRINDQWAYFESNWKPKKWNKRFRFLFIRQRCKQQRKQPVQLDLFIPHEYGYDFKVIITNKVIQAHRVLKFHNGRGAQEGVFAELKSQSQMDYVPTRKLAGNQIYLLSAILAHNLNRELQMQTIKQTRKTTMKRSPLWYFETIDSLRRTLIHRAGRITKPKGKVKLTMSANVAVKEKILDFLNIQDQAA